MKKKKILFMLIFTMILLFPFSVKADDEINITSVACPTIGQKPTYIGDTANQYVDRLEERWYDKTDHKVMKSTDTFKENHMYRYEYGFELKSSYEGKNISLPNIHYTNCNYVYSGDEFSRNNGFTYIYDNFYIGNINNYEDLYDGISLNIAQPTLGGKAPQVQSDSRYTINSQKWYNITENKEMGALDTFKANTKYKLTVNYSSLYSINSLEEKFGENEYFLGLTDWEAVEHIGQRQDSAYFYFGNKSDLEIEGTLSLDGDKAPIEGQKISDFEVTTNIPTQNINQTWYVKEYDNSYGGYNQLEVEPNAIFEAGKTYVYNISLNLEPGITIKDGFDVENNNKGTSFISGYTYNYPSFSGTYISYQATYTILENGKTFGIVNNGNSIIYPNYSTPLQIYPNDKANDNYTWKSSDENVATVDEYGWVYAHAPGTATITATNDSDESATYDIEIGVPAESITLNRDTITLYTGEETTIAATISPDNVTNKSISCYAVNVDSNYYMDPIANVGYDQNGNCYISARKKGTIDVRVSAQSGGVYKDVSVTVKEQTGSEIRPTNISIDRNEVDLELGSNTQLHATVLPNNADDKSVSWISSNPNVATVDNTGKVTAVNVGETQITAETVNGKKTRCLVRVSTNYAVTFYDGEEIVSGPQEYLSGTPIETIGVPVLVTEDKIVASWYTDKELTKEFVFTGTLDGDLDLYAKWEDINVSITTDVDSVDYGEVYQGFEDRITKNVKIINNGNVPVKLNNTIPTGSGPFGLLSFDPEIVISPGEEYEARLIANPSSPFSNIVGTYEGTYNFEGVYIVDIDKRASVNVNANITIKKLPMHVSYKTHVQTYGWQKYVKDGAMAGTTGEAKRLEGIKIKLENQDYDGDIEYRTHIQKLGWEEDYKKNGEMSGTTGKAYRLEAIQIRLTGEMKEHFDVYYRVHAQKFGWLGWTRNDEMSGTAGYAYRLEGIEIKLVEKGQPFSEYDESQIAFIDKNAVSQITLNKTNISIEAGEEKTLTAAITPDTATDKTLTWKSDNEDSVKVDQNGKITAVSEGTATITVASKNGKKAQAIVNVLPPVPGVSYTTHVQTYGWQKYVSNGKMAGTQGQAKRLEGIKIKLKNIGYDGDIEYKTHIQKLGWEEEYKKNDEMSGTEGRALRLEAIQIRLTGEVAQHYDIYYRVHAQKFGWLGWAKNDEMAGTAGYAYRLEGIEIQLVEKGSQPTENENQSDKLPFYENK